MLTKRAREPFKDWWDIPGGFVDEDESLEQALQRELKEELDIQAEDLKYVGSFAADYPYQKELVSVVSAVFSGRLPKDANIKVADDVSDYKLAAKSEIDISKIAFEKQRELLAKHLPNS